MDLVTCFTVMFPVYVSEWALSKNHGWPPSSITVTAKGLAVRSWVNACCQASKHDWLCQWVNVVLTIFAKSPLQSLQPFPLQEIHSNWSRRLWNGSARWHLSYSWLMLMGLIVDWWRIQVIIELINLFTSNLKRLLEFDGCHVQAQWCSNDLMCK